MKLIDADALWMEFIHRMDYCDDILEIVDEMPEAVVRCKECRYAHMSTDGRVKYCEVWFPDEAEYLDGDNYCSCGERGRNDLQYRSRAGCDEQNTK